jgi:hypothetical protein
MAANKTSRIHPLAGRNTPPTGRAVNRIQPYECRRAIACSFLSLNIKIRIKDHKITFLHKYIKQKSLSAHFLQTNKLFFHRRDKKNVLIGAFLYIDAKK